MDNDLLMQGLSEMEKQNLFGNTRDRMLWSCKSDSRFFYYVYVPATHHTSAVASKMMVYIHGTARRYETEQYSVYRDFAEENQCIILVPIFPGGAITPGNYNDYKLIVNGNFRYDKLLIEMVNEVKIKYRNVETEKFFLAGHSGGGQFVNRFYYLHPEKLLGVSISAPGRPTYLDETEDYYWGVKNWDKIFDKTIDMDALAQVPAQIVVGDEDIKFIGNSKYGANRNERIASLQENLEQHGIKVEKVIVPNMGHSQTREGFATPCNFFAKLIKEEI